MNSKPISPEDFLAEKIEFYKDSLCHPAKYQAGVDLIHMMKRLAEQNIGKQVLAITGFTEIENTLQPDTEYLVGKLSFKTSNVSDIKIPNLKTSFQFTEDGVDILLNKAKNDSKYSRYLRVLIESSLLTEKDELTILRFVYFNKLKTTGGRKTELYSRRWVTYLLVRQLVEFYNLPEYISENATAYTACSLVYKAYSEIGVYVDYNTIVEDYKKFKRTGFLLSD